MHTFETKKGDVILVAWLKTVIPGKRSDDKSGMVKDNRKEDLKLKIPMTFNGKITQYNELGESKDFKSVTREENATNIENLTLHGGEVTIIELKRD